METWQSYGLLGYFALYFFLGFVWRSILVFRQTGINPIFLSMRVALLGLVLVALAVVLLVSRPASRRWLTNRWQHWRHHLSSGALARATLPAALISVLLWANEALVLWLLVRLLAPAVITIPAAIAIYLLSATAGMASSLPGGMA